ncbi:cytochrome P450 family protein [Adhaeribacter radiodurans]|uniref:Uncharacterized protein n=1 Tax=Adhaeribacter radiodurans TaxID=2745197 RepID=A0A7L7LE40_9BACT|nr:hypothetical protein [Adhaeribacter radiodurans]QMU31122.1 hypothetical protein HUW48_25235 [Adhaeribacter radiodurans]
MQRAAVEWINVIRPIVAIATYITFSALAVHLFPAHRQKLVTDEQDFTEFLCKKYDGIIRLLLWWEQSFSFVPKRFCNWQGSPYSFIPQGSGYYLTSHRCANGWITIETTKLALNYLTRGIRFEVPKQDLTYPMSRMPTLPQSRVIMQEVRNNTTTVPVDQVAVHPES